MRALLAFGGGILIGFGSAYIALEDRFGKKYAEMANANHRAYERARMMSTVAEDSDIIYAKEDGTVMVADLKTETESVRAHGDDLPYAEVFTGTVENFKPVQGQNAYHKAIEAKETDKDTFVNGDVNDYGVSYIEEEEFEDEDGREKYHLDLILNGDNPLFLLEGVPVENWDDLVGESILIDMFKQCPPGIPAVLYVRNHRLDTDYEVVRVEP